MLFLLLKTIVLRKAVIATIVTNIKQVEIM